MTTIEKNKKNKIEIKIYDQNQKLIKLGKTGSSLKKAQAYFFLFPHFSLSFPLFDLTPNQMCASSK